MKANNLINSINQALNEGDYSKYTLPQLYIKLGKNLFFDYIKNICFTVVRRKKIELLENMEFMSRDSYNTAEEVFWGFTTDHEHYNGDLYLSYYVRQDKLDIQCGVVDCYDDINGRLSAHSYVSSSDVNVYKEIERGIYECSAKSGPLNSKIAEINHRIKLDSESK